VLAARLDGPRSHRREGRRARWPQHGPLQLVRASRNS
jgi:hypothetical protein